LPKPRPERYPHVWEGEYAKAFEGAYFARHLEQARQEGRICRVAVDPILPVKAFFDIGGAGHSSDAMAIWIAQFVGRETSPAATTDPGGGGWSANKILANNGLIKNQLIKREGL
jgi:hypothetical protein